MECNVYDRKDYGGFWRRYFADFFDGIFLAIAFGIVNAISENPIAILILDIMIFLTYMIGFKVYKGATPGYRILGMRTVSIDGAEVTVKQVVVRLLSSIPSGLALGLGFIWIAIDRNRQAWHDKVAGTYVIKSGANPVRTVEIPQTGLIRGKLLFVPALGSLVLLFGLFGGIMYSISDMIYLNLGIAYYKKGQYQQAISNYNKAIEINPRYAEAYTNRGVAYGEKDQYGKAISDFSKAIEINPRDAKAYYLRAFVYLHKKEDEKAWDDVHKAQNFGGQVPPRFLKAFGEAYKRRGFGWAKKGEWTRAIADFNKAIELTPDDAMAYLYRGSSCAEKDEIDQAIADYNKAIEIEPRNAWAYSQRGLAYNRKGQYDKAIAEYTEAIEIDPLNTPFYVNRGDAWDHKGNLDRAIANYNKAIELDPTYVSAYIERGVAYASSGDYQRAIQDCNKAIELDPNDAHAYKSRGNIFFYQARFALAEADYESYLRIKPKDIYRILWLYIAQERGGKNGLPGLSDNVKNVDVAKWPGPVAYLFLERISPEELFVETKDHDRRVEKERQCEAYFYLGQYYHLRNEKKKAAQMFKLCLETKVTSFVEYTAAKVELERMGLE
jgi:lipoprotein NlpI/uncharacterized RDD family membrane protein YckC